MSWSLAMEKRRNPKGAGGFQTVGRGRRARLRANGQIARGPIRKGPDSDRLLKRDLKKLVADQQPGKCPRLIEWAHECMTGLYAHRIAPATFATNDSIRRNHLNPSWLGQKRLDTITRRDCRKFAAELPGSTAWIHRVMAFVSALFSEAMEEDGLIDYNPCSRLKLPAIPNRNNRVLAAHEAIRLMNPQPGDLYAEMLYCYMMGGYRRAELCRAQWRDLVNGENRTWIRGTKNTVSATTHSLDAHVMEILRRQPKRSEYIFTRENGKPIDEHSLTQWFRRNKVKLGLPEDMRLQDLRGTYATLMVESGAHMKTVQRKLRHANEKTTMRVYTQSHFETQEEADVAMYEHIFKKSADHGRKKIASGQQDLGL